MHNFVAKINLRGVVKLEFSDPWKDINDQIRLRIVGLQNEIETLAQFAERLQSLLSQYQTLLNHNTQAESAAVPREARPKPKISFRAAVRQVMESHPDEWISIDNILTEVLKMGAISKAKRPANIVDFDLYNFKNEEHLPLERRSGGLWKWSTNPIETDQAQSTENPELAHPHAP